ncbi:hypothetical protein Tco_0672142, partial [Tanacetum coccineum]
MILPADHVLRAVIDARLPVPLLLLVCFWSYLFHAVMLSHQVGDVPLTCVAAVDYASGIHVASSNYWLASFFAHLFKMTNFAAKHSIMTPEMVENFCNDYYIPGEVHPVAPGWDNTITQFPKVFPIPVSLYVGGALEKDPVPHITACQEQTVRLLENNKAPFRRYPECFLCLVGLSPYYPFDENTYPAFERLDGTDMGLLDFIKTADPRKVQAAEVQKKDDQLRKDHPSFATGTGGKTLAGLRQLMPTSPFMLRPSFQADIQAHVVQSARITDIPVYTAAATVTSARENVGITPTSDVAGSSQLETSEGSDDSFYELPALNSAEAKLWYVPRWNITNDSLLDDEFNVGAARQICLESEVWSRAEHELELKEKLKGKYDARGRLLEEKDLEILRLKSLLVEEAKKAERAKTTEVVRLRGQVSALTREVSVLKSTVAQKDTDISLLDSRATYLKSALDDSKAACAEAGILITSLTSERDRLTSEA